MTAERITAIATMIYMLFTGRLIRETRQARIQRDSPQLDIFIERSKEWGSKLNLIIKNNWYAWAYNIKLSADKNVNLSDNENNWYTLQNLWYFKNGISFLPPNWERKTFFTFISTNYKEKIKRIITIFAEYKDSNNKIRRKTFLINLSEFENTTVPQTPPIYNISRDIEKIQKDIHSIILWSKQIKVLTQTKKEKIIEDKIQQKEIEKMIQDMKDR